MKFSQLFQHHIDRTDINKTDIANKIGKKKAYISNLTSGSRPPAPDTCVKIADALGLTGSNRKEFLETAYIERNSGKDYGYIKALNLQDYSEKFLRAPSSAGYIVEELPLMDWSELPSPPTKQKGGIMKYKVKVINDEMEDEFKKGDVIHVETVNKAVDGDFVIARPMHGFPILRLFKKIGSQNVLMALNREYPEIILNDQPHDIIGIVVEKVKIYKRK